MYALEKAGSPEGCVAKARRSYILYVLRRAFATQPRVVRKMLEPYAKTAGITRSVSPHKWRHFLFTWLKKQDIDGALIQPYSGHESRQPLGNLFSTLAGQCTTGV